MSTYTELAEAVRAEAEAKSRIAAIREQALNDLRNDIKAMIDGTPFNLTEVLLPLLPKIEVVAAKTKRARKAKADGVDGRRKPVEPKYRHPVTGQTWSGRGKRPAWVLDEHLIAVQGYKPVSVPTFTRTPEQIQEQIQDAVSEVRVTSAPRAAIEAVSA